MSFRLVPKSVTLKGEIALIFRDLTQFVSFRGELCKRGWQSHNYIYGQFTITMSAHCLVVK